MQMMHIRLLLYETGIIEINGFLLNINAFRQKNVYMSKL